MKKFLLLLILSPLLNFSFAQTHKVLESNSNYIKIEFDFDKTFQLKENIADGKKYYTADGGELNNREPGEPWLTGYNLSIGIPFNSEPVVKILSANQERIENIFILPVPDSLNQPFELLPFDTQVYNNNSFFPRSPVAVNDFVMRFIRIADLSISPYQFNPVSRELIFNKKLIVRVDFKLNSGMYSAVNKISDIMTDDYMKSSIINYEAAKEFVGKPVSGTSIFSVSNPNSYWYNPQKNYSKIYLKEKGVYRVAYEQLNSSGAQLGITTPTNKLELFNDGIPVPIEVFDNNSDQVFNEGDFFQFVGFPPTASPYCSMNIYNLSNVYWFSYQSDSTGLYYQSTPGTTTNFTRNYISNLQTIHLEKDFLYERLGYAPNENRDYWYWDKATANSSHSTYAFQERFNEFPDYNPDSNRVRLKVSLQGMTNSPSCNTEHKAYISITDQPVGNVIWDGQYEAMFDKTFYASSDSVKIYPTGNLIKVEVKGDVCQFVHNDEIRINWIEFDYWRFNRIHDKYFNFVNYDLSGVNRYFFWQWQGSDAHIYIPSKNKTIFFAATDEFITFMDTMKEKTEYFITSSDNFSTADSIVSDIHSDLRSLSNGADYIIITHSKFADIANQLASFRQNNFPDQNIPNPRIKIVDVQQIYDEFSYGLLDPFSLKSFVKHAFENWQSPAPSYIVLIGDMSYDYRALLESSRPNFIPSIPYFAETYGQAASDNLIVAASGNDVTPDLAIGRISIETVEEGNILLQKLFNYPSDVSKEWKQNILLIASGLGEDDDLVSDFNNSSDTLSSRYVEPNGFSSSKIFRYPTSSYQQPFQGEGPKIREEINKGAAIVNYYGHGGGFQWDLTFLNDDIYLLENGGRLPIIFSVTCYTAHFDDQDVFGEQFNKVEGKGSIGFYGSAGLTYWGIGKLMSGFLFDEIFNKKNYIIGKAILNSKSRTTPGALNNTQIALLTYLGDPVLKLALPSYPDFVIKSTDISLSDENPIAGDTVSVKVNINNLGTIFPGDSITLELFAGLADTSYMIGSARLSSFPEKDSVYFTWFPDKAGLFTLTAKVNETEVITEEDHSDNVAAKTFTIFNISDPNILKPVDGFSSSNNQVEFIFSDVGYYAQKQLKYYIEIDTSFDFVSPLIASDEIIPEGALVKWTSGNLSAGVYFWRARIYDGVEFGRWSPIRSFSLVSENKNGYYAAGKIFKTFSTYNINYSDERASLILNTEPLPARPSEKTLVQHFFPQQLPDSIKLTALTTDGTYIYVGNLWYTATQNNGYSMIYKFGTGNNGTIAGQFYGTIPNFRDSIENSIAYHSDGNLYVATGMSHKIVRINIAAETVDSVDVPSGLLRWDNTTAADGPVYITSDGHYIYNITTKDALGNYKYTVRTFDPSQGWSLVKPDIVLSGSSFQQGMTGFFVHGGYIYPAEYYNVNYMRRIRLSDGVFEEEWVVMQPYNTNFQSYYAWCWDWQNDNIYASVYRSSGFAPKFSKFAGYYTDANGNITSNDVGPAGKWNYIKYDLDNPNPSGSVKANLLGLNSATKAWDTLQINIPDSISISQLNPVNYSNLKLDFNLSDSSFSTIQPMELKSINFDYDELPDVYFEKEDLSFDGDSLLQGLPINLSLKFRIIGKADSLNLKFYLNGADSLIFSKTVPVISDTTSSPVQFSINTGNLIFENKIDVVAELNKREYFYYNNVTQNSFYVVRDSVKPVFNITFDGKEILDGDIISAHPTVLITLEDNSPLPIDTSYFSLAHTYENETNLLHFTDGNVNYNYTPFPESKAMVTWNPSLSDGQHVLEVLAKDASSNFFDSTSYRVTFNVYNESDLREVYNYPNPFGENTYFTFELRGVKVPDELKIKVYTVAGRQIRDINILPSALQIGFNRIYWDGRDQDGDEIANGLYFYKVIYKNDDIVKTLIQKLAKIQ